RIAWPSWSVWHAPDGDDIRALHEPPRAGPGGASAILAGTGQGKIFAFEADAPVLHPFSDAAGSAISDIATVRDPDGATLRIGVEGGLWWWNGARAMPVVPRAAPRSLWIAKLLATPRDATHDDLWVGLNATGLARWRAGVWQNLTERDGVDDSDNVTALLAD